MNKIGRTVQDLIRKAEVAKSLDYLLTILHPKLDKYQQVLILSGRSRKFQNDRISGVQDDKELIRISQSILQIATTISEEDLVFKDEAGKISELEISEIMNVINPNYESDLKNLEAVWDLDSVVSKKTILIVHGGHVFPELLDRVSGYLLQRKINEVGELEKLERAILLGDMQYQYASSFPEESKESIAKDLNIISIGSPSINEVSAEIILKNTEQFYDRGVNIAFHKENKRERVALWGASAFKTSQSVELFIKREENGLIDFLKRAWA